MDTNVDLALRHMDKFTPRNWRELWIAHLTDIARQRGNSDGVDRIRDFESLGHMLEVETCKDLDLCNAKIIVIDGASGTGKNHLGNHLHTLGLRPILRYKDRERRSDEIHGVDAYFINADEFDEMETMGELIGIRGSFGERRAYSRAKIMEALHSGERCYVAEGLSFLPLASQDPELREVMTSSVFLLPPSLEELIRRLVRRTCGDRVFDSADELVAFLIKKKIPERLEYGFKDLTNTSSRDDDRRRFLADCFFVYDSPARLTESLGIL